jgi:hypothetical protein
MGKRYISAYAECPFYHSEDEHKIYCEGVDEKSSIHLSFESKKDRRKYRQDKCEKDHKGCHIAKMLYGKYEEKDETK